MCCVYLTGEKKCTSVLCMLISVVFKCHHVFFIIKVSVLCFAPALPTTSFMLRHWHVPKKCTW